MDRTTFALLASCLSAVVAICVFVFVYNTYGNQDRRLLIAIVDAIDACQNFSQTRGEDSAYELRLLRSRAEGNEMIGQSLEANEAVLLFIDSVSKPAADSEYTKCVQTVLTERNVTATELEVMPTCFSHAMGDDPAENFWKSDRLESFARCSQQ